MSAALTFEIHVANAGPFGHRMRSAESAAGPGYRVVSTPILEDTDAVIVVRTATGELSFRTKVAAVAPLLDHLDAIGTTLGRNRRLLAEATHALGGLLDERGRALEQAKVWRIEQAVAHEHDTSGSIARFGLWRDRLGFELARAHAAGDAMGILLVDVDELARYNATHGYASGDRALRQVARLLPLAATGAQLRPCIFGRERGDAFGVIMPLADLAIAEWMAERTRELVQQVPIEPAQITASVVGVVGVPAADVTAELVLDVLARRLAALVARGRDQTAVTADLHAFAVGHT